MNPKGKVVPCPKCRKDFFAELDHGFWGHAKCPHCGEETAVMAPKSGQVKQMLRMMGTSEEEMQRLEALQEKINAERRRKQQYEKPEQHHEQSQLWKEMRLEPEHEKVAAAYFDAIIDSCRESGLVLTEEHGLFICVPPGDLYVVPVFNRPRKTPLQAISQFHEFLGILKSQVDEHMRNQGLAVAEADDYWSALMFQMESMIKESGAALKIMEIDKRFGLYKDQSTLSEERPAAQSTSEPSKKPGWWRYIFSKFKRDKKIAPVYAVVLKGDRVLTKSEMEDVIILFMKAGKLERPPLKARFAAFYDMDMRTDEVEGKFMISTFEELLEFYPDLRRFITISPNKFESNNLNFNIVGAETKHGYVRVIHIKEM